MSYYTHNLSPYIFTLEKLPIEKLQGPVGITLVIVLIALIVTFNRLRKTALQDRIWPLVAELTTLTVLVVGVVMFAMKKSGLNWGLRWYSTMYLLGFLQTYFLFKYWIYKKAVMLTQPMLDSLIAWLILGMIVGARSFYVFIYNFDVYSHNPLDAFKVWEGGLSFHGGIVGVITAAYIFCRKHRIPFFHLTDKMVLCVPFGIAMGRIGNFINGELYGRIIQGDLPWGVVFPDGGPQPRHPSQLYQSFCEGWLLLLTLYLFSRRPRAEGSLSAAFVFFYGFFRFFMEFFREADSQLQYYFDNTLTMGQILCLVQMAAAIAVYYYVQENIVEKSPDWIRRRDNFYISHPNT